jgi:hypothetical protein
MTDPRKRQLVPIFDVLFDLHTNERCIGGVGREGAHRYRISVKPVILNDQRRPRLAGVVAAAGEGPYLPSSHSSGQMEAESMNA